MGDLTQARLRELLDYDPETGVFTWKVRRGGSANSGSLAGRLNPQGYRKIGVLKKIYSAHRLVFLWMTGSFPLFEVDHKNGNRDDNRWVNLREALHQENGQNQGTRTDNTSTHPGVSWQPKKKLWVAYITVLGQRVTLGRSKSFEKACEIRKAAKVKYHPFQPSHRGIDA